MQASVASRPGEPRSVIFLHLPKTGGSTLLAILERQYPGALVRVGSDDAGEPRLPDLEPGRRIDCFAGHMPFGLHRKLAQPATYVTLLREPVDRVVSEFHFVERHSEHPLHRRFQARGSGLEEYVDVTEADLMTRWISGSAVPRPGDPLPRAALETAKRNLETHFGAVGLVERFDESLLLMKRALGWSHVLYRRKNVTYGRPGMGSHSAETLRCIRERNRLDAELYAFAEGLFERQLAEAGIGRSALVPLSASVGAIHAFERIWQRTPGRGGIKRLLRQLGLGGG